MTTNGTALNWGIPFIIIASYSLLAAQSDLSAAIPTLVGVTACIILLLAVALYAGEKMAINWSPGIVMIIAATLRLLFLFHRPELSDDIYRYVFDGLQSLMGNNPYAMAPACIVPETEELASLVLKVNHSHLVTIYPPAAQIIFALGTALGGGCWGLRPCW